MLQEQWKVADFLYECCQLRWQNPPAYLVTPVPGERQVQEADIPELSADEFESMLASSEYISILRRKGWMLTRVRFDYVWVCLLSPFFNLSMLAIFVDDFSP
jgi:hypothetical protein